MGTSETALSKCLNPPVLELTVFGVNRDVGYYNEGMLITYGDLNQSGSIQQIILTSPGDDVGSQISLKPESQTSD